LAKYLVLSFENDADADGFIKALQWHEQAMVPYIEQLFDAGNYEFVDCELVAVYKKPTKFCECTATKKRGWTRGKKYGWWVCDQCKKPSKVAATEVSTVTTYRNLLETGEQP